MLFDYIYQIYKYTNFKEENGIKVFRFYSPPLSMSLKKVMEFNNLNLNLNLKLII